MHTDRTTMSSSSPPPCSKSYQNLTIIFIFVVFSSFLSSCSSSSSSSTTTTPHFLSNSDIHHPQQNQTFLRPVDELQKLKRIRQYLKKINKPAVKAIQAISPDGDVIDCVPSHLQPAFDHPQLRGQKPLEPSERPKGHEYFGNATESIQLWAISGESCPEGSIPIRRTTEKDVLRASSWRRFGRKIRRMRHDTMSSDHEHAVAFVNGDQYYGAKASINVWTPQVTNEYEFSLSQVWIISGSFGNDLNTIEAGWQVSPELYGDNYPRFFTYWTTDAYQATGCYNLLCSGFVQTNNRISMGAAISPRSSYSSKQYDIGVMMWKDPKHGHWWLELGPGLLVGYWPSFLFTHLQSHASMVQFGGEIVNTGSSMGFHTSTQMGSGHFADEGFGKASYFRNLQVVDWDNNLIPLNNLHLLADHPNCYDIKAGKNDVWGNYFYYGGPGRNSKCP
ncbi:OLC1v1013109C1 [Oldenlandia corymbosa var. corymbosa]|uniref:OLC1v1013109C1 n=1 Tax=Oldenlandia corymbosa var. corymbosa TaxID=529605 RepID=A0AAV1E108_OLDCO|nr:OLC1v1013109C1 [Oldenlandia corymbosa var. corymbosa]